MPWLRRLWEVTCQCACGSMMQRSATPPSTSWPQLACRVPSEATTEVADCATPSNPAYTDRRIKSYDVSVSGAGVYDTASAYAFITWWQSGAAKNVKIYQNLTGAQGGWVITQSMVLTDLQVTGTRGERQEVTLTIKGAGKPTIAANA